MTSSALNVRPFAPKCAAPRRSAGEARDLTQIMSQWTIRFALKACRGMACSSYEGRYQRALMWTRLSVESLVIMHEVLFQETFAKY